MNRLAIYVAAAVMLLLFDRLPVQAISAPHNSPCLQCHVSHNKLGEQSNELICLQCHNASSGAAAQGMPFAPEDAANPFGTPNAMQISHNWNGSDTNLKAGALPPQDPKLAVAQHAGRMMCAKCHNLHGSRSSADNSAPFLRSLNEADQMCLDCHRPRNQQSANSGTHPVLVSYTGAAKRNPAGFNATPVSSNPANPTASLKLVNGQVSCSTCHAVHYADSNSKTFDNHSSALLGELTPSAGYLLRTDFRGETPNAVAICQNCHAGKYAHNAKGQNVQCTDCHGGHVDEADGTVVNVKLVRRYMTYSSATGKVSNRAIGKPTMYTSTTTKNFRDADGQSGVCQACHALPSGIAEHTQPNADCTACHRHDGISGAFSASGSCDTCHGQPPRANTAGGPNGYASGYVGVDESVSAHASHAGPGSLGYVCNTCHNGYNHRDGVYQDLFKNPAGLTASLGGVTPSYQNGTCTSYCHSNGNPRGGSSATPVPVAFANGKGAIIGTAGECAACHGNAATLNSNAHGRHLAKGLTCYSCHAATVGADGTIANAANHVNGNKDLQFTGVAAGTSFDVNNGNCSASYCHSNGKGVSAVATWTSGATGACGTCHATSTGLSGTLIATGAHSAHFTAGYGPAFTQADATGCQNCHSYTNELDASHVNQTVDLKGTLGYGSNNCTPCHAQTVSWTGGRVTCESCHTGALSVVNGKTAPDKSQAAISGHGAKAQSCAACHDNNSAHIGATGSRLQAALTGSLNVECKYCHDDAAKVTKSQYRNMSTHFLVKGGSQAMGCAQCHDPHGNGNLSMIRSSINSQTVSFQNRSTGYVDRNSNQGLCQACHTQTNHYKAGVAETNHYTKNCMGCHKHNAGGGAFKPKGECDSCHGYPPAPKNVAVAFGTQGQWTSARFEDYSGGGGAHLVAAHINPNAKASEGWANCAVCHNGGNTSSSDYHTMQTPLNIQNVTIKVDPQYRFSNSFIVYTGAKLFSAPATNATGSCFNISCHISPSPRWSTER